MSLKSSFLKIHPTAYYLDANDLPGLQNYLQGKKYLFPDEEILSSEKPGDGNMNYVLRIITSHRTFILKQARPWAEKYPQIAAPVERSAVEAYFLEYIQKQADLRNFSPKLWWSDPDNFIFAQEDLGKTSDYTFIYQKGQKITVADLENAVRYLRILHSLPLTAFPDNLKMRKLNHEHIFHFPFKIANGLNLDSIQKGLEVTAAPFKLDISLKNKISRLGEIYLSPGRSLIHGDFYPGSWLKRDNGLKIIDPEFAFQGPPEFDLAILCAHMLMAEQGIYILKRIWHLYQAPANFDQALLSAFTGIEIMRRIIGIAQLPLSLSIADKINLLAKAAGWIREENLVKKLLASSI
jgi:5-methylthioribose kinase